LIEAGRLVEEKYPDEVKAIEPDKLMLNLLLVTESRAWLSVATIPLFNDALGKNLPGSFFTDELGLKSAAFTTVGGHNRQSARSAVVAFDTQSTANILEERAAIGRALQGVTPRALTGDSFFPGVIVARASRRSKLTEKDMLRPLAWVPLRAALLGPGINDT